MLLSSSKVYVMQTNVSFTLNEEEADPLMMRVEDLEIIFENGI